MNRLGDKALEGQVLERFRNASHLLLPHNGHHDDLRTMKPVYCASFIIGDGGAGERYLRLDLEFEDEGKEFSRTQKRWLNLHTGAKDLAPMMDYNVVDVQGYRLPLDIVGR